MTKIIYRVFIFILIFSPLAFGTVEQWSLTVMEVLTFVAVLLLLLRKLQRRATFVYEIPGIIPLTILSAFILLQLIPLPLGIVKFISSSTYSLYKETAGIVTPQEWVSLSINKKATLMEFFRIITYGFFYILTIQILTKKEALKKTVAAIIIFASLLSLFAIIQHILSNNKIFWVRELTQGGTPFGPYVNRNHYAGFMGMVFPVVLSLFLVYKPKVIYKSFRERLAEIFNQERTNIYILLGFSSILVATSVFLSLSRGGIVSLSLSMIFFGGMLLNRESKKKRGILIITLFILIVLSVGWFGWEPVFERFERIRNPQGDISEQRLVIWKDSMNIIKDFPLTGTGFGSFINIYPGYRTLSGDGIADHTHNDYIELFTDGGIIAVLLTGWFMLALFYKSYRTFLKRGETYSIYLFIGSATGMVSILLHSITDFNLHIGANGLYFFFLSGLMVSAANTRLRDGLNNSYLKKIKLPFRPLTVLMVSIILVCFVFNIGVLAGKFYFSLIKEINLNKYIPREELLTIKDMAYKASFYDPLEAKYYYAIANTEMLLSNSNNALNNYIKAVKMNPLNGEYLQRLGIVVSGLKEYDRAEKLLRAGIKYDINNPVRYRTYASWLLSRGVKKGAIRNIKMAISLQPRKTKDYIALMVLYGLSDEEMLSSLPERVEPYLLFADYLYNTGKEDMAEDTYLDALKYVKNEKEVRPSYFYTVYRYYMKKGLHDEALKVMQKAIEFVPDNAGIRLTTAALYEKLGITYRAIEEYKRALVIDPENLRAKRRLDKIMSTTGL